MSSEASTSLDSLKRGAFRNKLLSILALTVVFGCSLLYFFWQHQRKLERMEVLIADVPLDWSKPNKVIAHIPAGTFPPGNEVPVYLIVHYDPPKNVAFITETLRVIVQVDAYQLQGDTKVPIPHLTNRRPFQEGMSERSNADFAAYRLPTFIPTGDRACDYVFDILDPGSKMREWKSFLRIYLEDPHAMHARNFFVIVFIIVFLYVIGLGILLSLNWFFFVLKVTPEQIREDSKRT